MSFPLSYSSALSPFLLVLCAVCTNFLFSCLLVSRLRSFLQCTPTTTHYGKSTNLVSTSIFQAFDRSPLPFLCLSFRHSSPRGYTHNDNYDGTRLQRSSQRSGHKRHKCTWCFFELGALDFRMGRNRWSSAPILWSTAPILWHSVSPDMSNGVHAFFVRSNEHAAFTYPRISPLTTCVMHQAVTEPPCSLDSPFSLSC